MDIVKAVLMSLQMQMLGHRSKCLQSVEDQRIPYSDIPIEKSANYPLYKKFSYRCGNYSLLPVSDLEPVRFVTLKTTVFVCYLSVLFIVYDFSRGLLDVPPGNVSLL